MTKIALGRISKPLPRQAGWRRSVGAETMASGDPAFVADAFSVPEYGIFGVAHSYHAYDAPPYLLAQRDVRLAFDTLRAALRLHDRPQAETDSAFLQKLLLLVAEAFMELNEPLCDEDFSFIPRLSITVARLQGNDLTYARAGDDRLFLVEPWDDELGPGWLGLNQAAWLVPGLGPSGIELGEWALQPWQVVVLATRSMEEAVGAAKLDELIGEKSFDPDVASQRLLDLVKYHPRAGDPPETVQLAKSIENGIRTWGAAWAVACAEGKPGPAKKLPRRRPPKAKRLARRTKDYDDYSLAEF